MGKLCLRPASPVPLAHTQGFRHLTEDRSGLRHTRIMVRLEPGSLTPSLHAASGDDVPCLLQYQELALCHPLPRGLPESSFRIAQRLPHLPRGWSQTISQGSSVSARSPPAYKYPGARQTGCARWTARHSTARGRHLCKMQAQQDPLTSINRG